MDFLIFVANKLSMLRQKKVYRDKFVSLYLAKFVVLVVLCRNSLLCGSCNSYVTTLKSFSQQRFCAASSNWCHDLEFSIIIKIFSHLFSNVATVLFFVTTIFLMALWFLYRNLKFHVTILFHLLSVLLLSRHKFIVAIEFSLQYIVIP